MRCFTSIGAVTLFVVLVLPAVKSQGLEECGRSKGDILDKPQAGDFPYFCTLFVQSGKQRIFIGGATLLSTRVVLTLGTLMTNLDLLEDGPCGQPKFKLNVRCGDTHTKLDSESAQSRLVERIILHKSHSNTSLINDYAMLVVDTPFKYTEQVGRVCLPDIDVDDEKDFFNFDEDCVVLGHGDQGQDGFLIYSDELRMGSLKLVGRSTCESQLVDNHFAGNGIQNWKLHNTHVCAEGGDNDTCKGDGGGPILCRYDVTSGKPIGPYIQVGVTAWGAVPCSKNVNKLPGVYSRLSQVTPWLNKTIECLEVDDSDDYDVKSVGTVADDFGLRTTEDDPICNCVKY